MPGKYKWLLGSALLLILLVVTFFIVRNPLLRHVVINRFKRIEQRTGADVVWQDISFSGFNGVQIKNLCVLPSTGDTLFSVDELNISMNTRYLLRFKLRVEQLTLDRPRIKLWRREGESNYLFLFGGMKDSLSGNQQSAPQVKNYSRLVKSIFEPLFQYVPQKVKIIDARLNADLDHYFIHAEMSDLSMKDAYFKSTIHLIDNGINRQWKIEGRIQPDEQNLYFKIVSGDTPRVELPYTAHRWNLTLAFDSLKVNCNYAAVSTGEVSLSGEAAAWQQVLHHPGISPDDVELRKGETHFKLNFGDTWAEVDSATAITYNKQQFHLFARYEQVPEKRYRIGINEKDMNAQVFF
ncbi:MAG: hypothetical protein PHX54_11600, partial [Lentimicrobiaceae bacterium]|nr:hypothetical protein [Lentimicrobiaceae bacterium]